MLIVFALISGLIIGGGSVGIWLSRRWQQQIKDAETSLTELVSQHQQEQQAGKELRQQAADLSYQLNEASKTIRYLESRQDNLPAP
ncbi:hypothetical protein [Candidatus Thalassolituus haligoni]|jgi:DNA-binding transcriptional regulator GbsR (MarR family)|uniref:hypothetical protein n=1 Tax=Candidatus Thalassolituus haligoni TaxID=3100113 RepID=UPI003514BC42|tara:strand:- start:7682 stop:7939 length:258 start_codon:yes stop_codon:yes gene_type:complete